MAFTHDSGLDPDERAFSSAEVSRIAQVSLRQLQWWDERGAISPRQENKRRVYSAREVMEILIVAALRRKRLSLQKIRRILRLLRRELARAPGSIGGSRLWLLTDGAAAYLEEHPERILDRLAEARQAMYLVCLSDQAQRIASEPALRRHVRRQLELF
ncbi:MAG TPA: MerR family transcriptional regulator [Bryobacteraceae bacterium]|nr:MerR family transcriptional regulator [Bryobacteraceae bacterium]